MTRAFAAALLGVALALVACGSRVAPADGGVDEREPPPPVLPLSRFDVPLAFDITEVLGVADRAVPTEFGSLDSVHQVGDDDRKHYAFRAERGPLTASGRGTEFHLRATLEYEARGFFKCGFVPTVSAGSGTFADRPPRRVVELATPLSLSAN